MAYKPYDEDDEKQIQDQTPDFSFLSKEQQERASDPNFDPRNYGPLQAVSDIGSTYDRYSSQPVRAAALAAMSGQDPLKAALSGQKVTAGDVASKFLQRSREAGQLPSLQEGQPDVLQKPTEMAADFLLDPTNIAMVAPNFGRTMAKIAPKGAEILDAAKLGEGVTEKGATDLANRLNLRNLSPKETNVPDFIQTKSGIPDEFNLKKQFELNEKTQPAVDISPKDIDKAELDFFRQGKQVVTQPPPTMKSNISPEDIKNASEVDKIPRESILTPEEGRTNQTSRDIQNLYEEAIRTGHPAARHFEDTPENFHQAINSAKSEGTKKGEQISKMTTDYPVEEYKNMRTFLAPDRKSGYAIKPDGELVSVFSSMPGRGNTMVKQAIENGASKLDNFDGYLTKLYEKHGFREYGRVPNNTPGEPDVVYMALPEKHPELFNIKKASGFAHGGEVKLALMEHLRKLRGY